VRPAAVAAVAPVAAVHPSHGLAAGSQVTVGGTGLAADTQVALIECDVPTSVSDEGTTGCSPIETLTTTAHGTLSVQLNTSDPVYRNEPYGDPVPVYCRADVCRYFLEWTDADGFHSVATPRMYFAGSPATIAVAPATGLVDESSVLVSGSAHGSAGRYVTIVEESCFAIIQGSGCEGAIPLATVKLSAAGTFRTRVRVYRYLGDGEDCVGSFYGCELSVTVLGTDGEPDDTFGVSRLGQPAASVEFAG
jgi:hypothetical protein